MSPFLCGNENSRPVSSCRRVRSRAAPKLAIIVMSERRFGLWESPPYLDPSWWKPQPTEAASYRLDAQERPSAQKTWASRRSTKSWAGSRRPALDHMPFLVGRDSSRCIREISARSSSKSPVSEASQSAPGRCLVPLRRQLATRSPSSSSSLGHAGVVGAAAPRGVPPSSGRPGAPPGRGTLAICTSVLPPRLEALVLTQPVSGPLPESLRYCKRSPSNASSSTLAPKARRDGSAREQVRRPFRTTTPPSPLPPTTCQTPPALASGGVAEAAEGLLGSDSAHSWACRDSSSPAIAAVVAMREARNHSEVCS
mmetsp:Transcript_127102/g.395581  ORF Transcript_127102/g.395581 Transcript_127102/m.395581 type:complete len:311 (-) Transcript_127102:90-1022(-)